MSQMTDEIRTRIDSNLIEARESRHRGDWDQCWRLLEDAREVRGQILRLLAGAPVSAIGRYPTGNTGRARVPATRPMPIRPDLDDVLRRAGHGHR